MRFLSPRAFKSLARLGQGVPTDGQLRKEFIGKIEAFGRVAADRQLRFTASTGAVDREHDRIDPRGWQLASYLANPVILWAHRQSELPIGKAVEIGIEGDALKMTVEFVSPDVPVVGPMAEAVYQLCLRGFLTATSVGFRPLTWSVPGGESARGDDWMPGVDFETQELLEVSICGIPCNPEALMDPGQEIAPASPAPLGVEAATAQADAVLSAIKDALDAAEQARAYVAEIKSAQDAMDRNAAVLRARMRRTLDVLALG